MASDGRRSRGDLGLIGFSFGRSFAAATVAAGLILATTIGLWAQNDKEAKPSASSQTKAKAVASPKATGSTASEQPSPSPTQTPSGTQTAYGDWVLRCSKPDAAGEKSCELVQFLEARPPQPIAEIAIGRLPGKDKTKEALRLVVVLPNNVAVTTPVRMSVDERDRGVDLTFERCLPSGCYANAVFRTEIASQWRAQDGRGRMSFKDGANNEIVWPFSFHGLTKALDGLGAQ